MEIAKLRVETETGVGTGYEGIEKMRIKKFKVSINPGFIKLMNHSATAQFS